MICAIIWLSSCDHPAIFASLFSIAAFASALLLPWTPASTQVDPYAAWCPILEPKKMEGGRLAMTATLPANATVSCVNAALKIVRCH